MGDQPAHVADHYDHAVTARDRSRGAVLTGPFQEATLIGACRVGEGANDSPKTRAGAKPCLAARRWVQAPYGHHG